MFLITYFETVLMQHGYYTQKAKTLAEAIKLFEKDFTTRRVVNIKTIN